MSRSLDDLEMFEVMRAAYPNKFKDDEDETWDAVQEFVDELSGFDDIADLLGRVVMLTNPIQSELTKKLYHCLGSVKVKDGNVFMMSAVNREVDGA